MSTFEDYGAFKFTHWRFWSDCENSQSDLNLRWAHMSEGTLAAHVSPYVMYDEYVFCESDSYAFIQELDRSAEYLEK